MGKLRQEIQPLQRSILLRRVVEKEVILLLEVVVSAFKLPVWGGHTCGSQRVAWTVILPCFEAGSLPALSIPLEL